MGYFSNLAIDEDTNHHDISITPPEQQLLWRLDDLRDRLEELKNSGAPYGGVCCYTKSDLRYAPTDYFSTIYDVETAIELAIEDLRNKYGIEVAKETSLQKIVFLSPYCIMLNIDNSLCIHCTGCFLFSKENHPLFSSYKIKVDNMVVFRVSTFILQFH